jgi:hypothetical protein
MYVRNTELCYTNNNVDSDNNYSPCKTDYSIQLHRLDLNWIQYFDNLFSLNLKDEYIENIKLYDVYFWMRCPNNNILEKFKNGGYTWNKNTNKWIYMIKPKPIDHYYWDFDKMIWLLKSEYDYDYEYECSSDSDYD